MKFFKKKDERPFLWMFGTCVMVVVLIGLFVLFALLIVWLLSWSRADQLGLLSLILICIVVYFLCTPLPPIQALSRPVKKFRTIIEVKVIEANNNLSNQDLAYIAQEVNRQLVEAQERLDLFLRYAHLTLGPYVSSEDLLRLDDYIESYALQGCLSNECVRIWPQNLSNVDLFHFGWNMAHYFNREKQEVAPWLQSVFGPLKKLVCNSITRKLCSSRAGHKKIPIVTDIAQYMVERERG